MVEEYRTAGRYALAFAEDAITVELDAWDRASAFATAQRLVKQGRSATLLEDGESIARLSYSPEGYWTVSEEVSRVG
jgi:hypothetical protein